MTDYTLRKSFTISTLLSDMPANWHDKGDLSSATSGNSQFIKICQFRALSETLAFPANATQRDIFF